MVLKVRHTDGSTTLIDLETIRNSLDLVRQGISIDGSKGPDPTYEKAYDRIIRSIVDHPGYIITRNMLREHICSRLRSEGFCAVSEYYAKCDPTSGDHPLPKESVWNTPIPWGPLGRITHKRTYAQKLGGDPSANLEEFQDTLKRVVEGCQRQLHVGFDADETERFIRYALQLKGSLAGRFLWQLGTKTVDKIGMGSLQNCAFTVVDHPIAPFTWAFGYLMLGAGVGFSVCRRYRSKIPTVIDTEVEVIRSDHLRDEADFVIDDSREGWVEFLEKVLHAYFYEGRSFTYSTHRIRPKGTPLRTFGGIASGPDNLCVGIERICTILKAKRGDHLSSVDCLDIMTIIADIVVSGNVRRSAMIAIGDCDDVEFIQAKRGINNIPSWRYRSNNSVECSNLDDLPKEYWDAYYEEGEPCGLINIDLAKKVGRLMDGEKYPDPEVNGFNPCAGKIYSFDRHNFFF
jgi:adenosylcobalamin-dependent ribonucleoside-triphosphate reductase